MQQRRRSNNFNKGVMSLLLLMCSWGMQAQDDSMGVAGNYALIQGNGWTNITLPNGDRAEIAPLPQRFTSSLQLDERHYCALSSTQFEAGIQTVMYGRWRLQHDTLTLTFSKQMSNLWWPPSPVALPTPYKQQYIVAPESAALLACTEERKAVYRRVGDGR